MIFCLAILLVSTLFWALNSASLQASNADQLVNSYLFGNPATFHGATLPAAHSFLIKWPLFLTIKLFGFSSGAFLAVTALTTLITVACLAAIIYWIERRPLVLGTLWLALASALLLVPAQPYAGGILPVNMAMLATRNLEYVIYVISLVFIARASKLKSWQFWSGTGLLSLLIASDKLFLTLSLGGALLALVAYALTRHWKLVTTSVMWLVGGGVAAVGAFVILAILQSSGVTHIANQAGAGPYGLIHTANNAALGGLYAVLGLLTNFGANPAYDATVVHDIPHHLQARLLSLGGPVFIINLVILTAGLAMAWHLLKPTLTLRKNKDNDLDWQSKLSLMLIWTSLAAICVFVASNHYYAVDARYLSVTLFALFITAATFTRRRHWQPEGLVLTGAIIFIGILCFGLITTIRQNNSQQAALDDVNHRNSTIAQVLAHHPVKWLVGDYWRVIPTQLASGNTLNTMPLSDCTTPRDVLSSQIWQPDLRKQSFAYLLSVDGSLTNYPQCNLAQVVKQYGRPNTSTVIAGSLSNPKELLLFYDRGARKSSPSITSQLSQQAATVVPINIDQLPFTYCSVPTVMNIIAHQDDDLLFMNPDLQHDIKAGHCVRTIYMTAGDAGAGKFYWLSRERGSEAAYSAMVGPNNDIWTERIIKLSNNQFATVANPRGNAKISLIFLHLPDGNLRGEGFDSSQHESLARLEDGKVSALHSVDGQSKYDSGQLVSGLTEFMHAYQPTVIRTQANYVAHTYTDHSDHMAVGRYVKRAYAKYENQQYEGRISIPLEFYIGYPIREKPANVSGTDLEQKQNAFLTYAKFDSGVCSTIQKCAQTPTYGSYLTRQYQNPY